MSKERGMIMFNPLILDNLIIYEITSYLILLFFKKPPSIYNYSPCPLDVQRCVSCIELRKFNDLQI